MMICTKTAALINKKDSLKAKNLHFSRRIKIKIVGWNAKFLNYGIKICLASRIRLEP